MSFEKLKIKELWIKVAHDNYFTRYTTDNFKFLNNMYLYTIYTIRILTKKYRFIAIPLQFIQNFNYA